MYQFPVNFEFFHKKTNIIAIGTIGSGILNIVLNFIMIPILGMYGAAIATALSYGVLFLAHYGIVKNMKEHPFHLNITTFVPGLSVVFAVSILFYVLKKMWYIRWSLGVIFDIYELIRIYKRKTIF